MMEGTEEVMGLAPGPSELATFEWYLTSDLLSRPPFVYDLVLRLADYGCREVLELVLALAVLNSVLEFGAVLAQMARVGRAWW